MNNYRFQERGFTLIEVIAVIIVLSVVSTVAIQGFQISNQRQRERNLNNVLMKFRTAIDLYYFDNLKKNPNLSHLSRFPSSLSELVELKYLRSIPVDPISNKINWEEIMVIDKSGNQRLFDIKSKAAGLTLGGELYSEL